GATHSLLTRGHGPTVRVSERVVMARGGGWPTGCGAMARVAGRERCSSVHGLRRRSANEAESISRHCSTAAPSRVLLQRWRDHRVDDSRLSMGCVELPEVHDRASRGYPAWSKQAIASPSHSPQVWSPRTAAM